MTPIRFNLGIDPKPQRRHRDRAGGRGKYDPSKKDKSDFLKLAMPYAPSKPLLCSIRMTILFTIRRPASHYGTGRNVGILKGSAPEMHIYRPDIDNLGKFVKDALNGIFYLDDSQICQSYLSKHWGKEPGIFIKIQDVSAS